MLNKTIDYFKEISKIPRCSGHEGNIGSWIISWALEKGYQSKKDEVWNIVVLVPATVWMEDCETVVLQSHIDMVCVKWNNSSHDFVNDWIEIIEEDWFLKANNTTLWADNGIWVAMWLVASGFEKHPRLELFCTVDEEKGMTWALELKSGFLSWTKMINIDTEHEGEIIIGSAGWAIIDINTEFSLEDWELEQYKINISWLKWWHSWLEIDKSKWNVVDCLIQFLEKIWWDVEFYNINSWIAENIISKELETIVWIENNSEIEQKIIEFKKEYIEKYEEDWIKISIEKVEFDWKTIWNINSNKIINAIKKSYSWVYDYSDIIDWLVKTSQNLWIIKLDNWELEIRYLVRSFSDLEIDKLIRQKEKNFWEFTSVIVDNKYPGWEENKNSQLLKIVVESYKKITNTNVLFNWIHAWLECWAIADKMVENSEIVSIGPNIYWAHTENEKCEIRSVRVLLEILEDILKNI